jgi:hypothetical protein
MFGAEAATLTPRALTAADDLPTGENLALGVAAAETASAAMSSEATRKTLARRDISRS